MFQQHTFEPGYLVFEGDLILNNRKYSNMFSNYLLEEGFTNEDLITIKQYKDFLNKKYTGLDYNGTLIPFTKNDTDGLNHIYQVLTNKQVEVIETSFNTSIDTNIVLNLDNIDNFYNWYCVNRNKFFITYEEFKTWQH